MNLDQIEAAEGPPGVESAVDALLAKGDPPPELTEKTISVLSTAGRSADALRVALSKPSVFRDLTLLPHLVEGCAITGNVELVEKLDLFRQVVANPATLMRVLGGPLLRCAPQMLARSIAPGGLNDFLTMFARRKLVADTDALAPMALALFNQLETPVARQLLQDGPVQDLPVWGRATLARQDLEAFGSILGDLQNATREQMFPEARVICRFGTGGFCESLKEFPRAMPVPDDTMMPALIPTDIEHRTREAAETTRALWLEHPARSSLGPMMEWFDRPENAPILVLSTGRAGTRSLNALLLQSSRHAPFHFFNFHKEAGDLNRLFYGILRRLTGPGDLGPAFERFLHDRLIELAWCAARGTVPVIINHLDLVHLPFYVALFENLKVIHIHRDPAKTLISHAYKQQYRYQQIRPLISRETADRTLFQYHRPPGLSLEENVVWFMRATDLVAGTAQSLLGDRNYTEIDMDRVFSREKDGLDLIAKVFTDDALTPEFLTDHFSEKINEKAHYQVAEKYRDPDRARDIYESSMAVLKEHGRYPDPT